MLNLKCGEGLGRSVLNNPHIEQLIYLFSSLFSDFASKLVKSLTSEFFECTAHMTTA